MNKQKNNIKLKEEAIEDIKNLPDEVRDDCLDMLKKLVENIHLGKPLDNLFNMDLRGYYKLYFHKAKYRIIYKKHNTGITIQAVVIGVGERNNMNIYKTVDKRINDSKND